MKRMHTRGVERTTLEDELPTKPTEEEPALPDE